MDANAEIEAYLKYQTSAGNAPSSWILSAILKTSGHTWTSTPPLPMPDAFEQLITFRDPSASIFS